MTTWQQIVSGQYGMCFGCGQDNPIGLKLDFKKAGKAVRAEFTPTEPYQGWPGVAHGGIIATILDEAASWAILFEGVNPVTAKMEISFKQPMEINKPMVISAAISRRSSKWVETKADIAAADGNLIAESKAKYFIIKQAKETNTGK